MGLGQDGVVSVSQEYRGVEGQDLTARVEALRRSAAPDLYNPDSYIPWDWVDRQIAQLSTGIAALDSLVLVQDLEADPLATALAEAPRVLDVAKVVLVSSGGAGFADGRQVPAQVPSSHAKRLELANLLLELGLGRIIHVGSTVADTVLVGLIAIDTRRRGFRRRDLVNEQVRNLLNRSLRQVEAEVGIGLRLLRHPDISAMLRGRIQHVIAINDRPVAAVVIGIYSQSGGRQQRELAYGYPQLQRFLDEEGLPLIAIVDGRFVTEAPGAVLAALLSGVAYAMTVKQASSGTLVKSIISAATSSTGRRRSLQPEALTPLIASALATGAAVEAGDLPADRDQARLALSTYAASKPDQALVLAPDGLTLRWQRPERVVRSYSLTNDYSRTDAVELLRDLLRATHHPRAEEGPPAGGGPLYMALLRLPEDRILPSSMLVAASDSEPNLADIKTVARTARRASADATLAVLLVPELPAFGTPADPAVQRALATSVVLLDGNNLAELAASRSPRDVFVHHVLRQADLSKANPFNPTGATRRRMFFGRDEEEANLLATLEASSAALLGGRRIGKTSLLQRAVETLESEGWASYYADCQSVGDWKSFVGHVQTRWHIGLSRDFEPEHLRSLVDQLASRSSSRLVIALDEIDYLLRWDQKANNENVPEAFFRACRALSQEGAVRFIFSGERLIAEKMWDPTSPHYNFCRPLPVQQLSQEASSDLILQPLAALGISLSDIDSAGRLAWWYTSGHPHLLQLLGERIVAAVNQRPPAQRSQLEHGVVSDIAETSDYRNHYVQTYWGQSTPLERLLTVLISAGAKSSSELRSHLAELAVGCDSEQILQALRMLELYGVLQSTESPYEFRAEWFREASRVLGPEDAALADLAARISA